MCKSKSSSGFSPSLCDESDESIIDVSNSLDVQKGLFTNYE